MRPVQFRAVNAEFARHQNEYLPLWAHKDEYGTVTTCWELSWWERVKMFVTGRLWVQVMTFNGPLQPIRPTVGQPEVRVRGEDTGG